MLSYSDIAARFGDAEIVWPEYGYATPPLPTRALGTPAFVSLLGTMGKASERPRISEVVGWRAHDASTGALLVFVAQPVFKVTGGLAGSDVSSFEVDRLGGFDEVRQGLADIRTLIGATSEAFFTGGERSEAEVERLRDVLRGTLGPSEAGAWVATAPDYFAWIGIS